MRSALNPRTGGAPPWYQKSLLHYFDAISQILTNLERFLKRSALNPRTWGGPPWYQKSLLRYFDAISTILKNFGQRGPH